MDKFLYKILKQNKWIFEKEIFIFLIKGIESIFNEGIQIHGSSLIYLWSVFNDAKLIDALTRTELGFAEDDQAKIKGNKVIRFLITGIDYEELELKKLYSLFVYISSWSYFEADGRMKSSNKYDQIMFSLWTRLRRTISLSLVNKLRAAKFHEDASQQT